MWDDSVIPRMCQLTVALQVPQHLGLPAPVPPREGSVVTALDPPLAATSVLRVTRGGLCESFGDALAGKATATPHVRAGLLFRYSKFWIAKGHDPWPLQEEMAYTYFEEVRPSTAQTHLRSCLISMSSAMHVLNLHIF